MKKQLTLNVFFLLCCLTLTHVMYGQTCTGSTPANPGARTGNLYTTGTINPSANTVHWVQGSNITNAVFTMSNSAKVVIKTGSTVSTFAGLTVPAGCTVYVESGVTLNVNGGLSVAGTLINLGTINVSSYINPGAGATYNDGTINGSSYFWITNTSFTYLNGGTTTCTYINYQVGSTSGPVCLRAGSVFNIISPADASVVTGPPVALPAQGLFQYNGTDITSNSTCTPANPARINYYAGFIISTGFIFGPFGGLFSNSPNITIVGSYPSSSSTGSSVRVTSGTGYSTSSPQNFNLNTHSPVPEVTGSYYKYCLNSVVPLASMATGTNLRWYTTATGGTGSATAPTVNTSAAGLQTFWVSQNVTGSCEGPRNPINIEVVANTATTLTVSNNGTCVGSPLVLTGPAGYTNYYWTGPLGFTSTSQSPTVSSSATAAMSGTYTLVAVQSTGSCYVSGTTTATILSTPSAPSSSAATSVLCDRMTANWSASSSATAYLLDVATTVGFTAGTFVSGYSNLNVGNVTTYNITGLNPNTTYYYRIRATNTCGTSGNSGVITTTTAANPAITTQPTNQTTCQGVSVSFSVVASGAGSGITYQWRKGGVNIPSANSSTYTIASPVVADAGNYDVVVGGTGCSSVTSNTVTLTVNPLPVITSQPIPVTLCSGNSATFTVAATGASTYQWRKGGVNISGATSSSYTIPVTVTGDAGNYDVVITSGSGCPVTSSAVALTVNQSPAISQLPATANLIANYRFNGNANDLTNTNHGVLQNTPVLVADRSGTANTAYSFNGTSQHITTSVSYNNPSTFSLSLWFNTTTTTGGNILSFGNAQTGVSGTHDRHVYMDNNGKVYFGVFPGAVRTITDNAVYNDGLWHHVVATLSPANGIRLYIDGALVASDATATTAQNYSGYWRIAYDNVGGWTNSPTSNYFAGSLDDILIYNTELTSVQALSLYTGADGASSNSPVCEGGTLNLSATTIAGAGYAWTGPNTFSSSAQNPSVTGMNTAKTGTYLVTVTGANGCVARASTVVTLNTTLAGLAQFPTSGLQSRYRFSGDAKDAQGVNHGMLQNSPVLTTDRYGNANSAYSFNGSNQHITTSTAYTNPSTFTLSVWINTTTSTGGNIISFGNAQTGGSSAHDRHVYMDNNGRVYFGVYPGVVRTIASTFSYNDGNWHLITASLSGTGMRLYIDGALVASDATTTTAENTTGYWRIAYDNVGGWTNSPTSNYFSGKLDDIFIYNRELTATEVAGLYNNPDGAGSNSPVCAGAALNLTAPTIAGVTYGWTGPNSYSSSSQNPTVTATAALTHAGTYTLTLTQGSCIYRSYAMVSVTTPATITTQPASQTVCVGSPVTFTVATTGTYLTYQWKKNGVNLSGATSTTYNIASAVTGDAGNYTVAISNSVCGTITSNTAALTVNIAPVISTHPASTSVCAGSSGIFTVVISAGTNPSFQWRKNGVNVGANSFLHTTPATTAGDNGAIYSVVVSNTGCTPAISNDATLTVYSAPAITTQPASQTICLGNPVTFSVVATGTSITYQWRKAGVNIGGANSASYNIAAVSAPDAANYDVVVGNAYCPSTISASAVLTVSTINQWNGSAGNNWFTASNWSCNVVPNTTLDAVIPSLLGTYPVISGVTNAVAKNINIASGASLTMSGFTSLLEVYGNWTNAGTFNAGTGKVEFKGTATQTLTNQSATTKERFYRLSIDKTSGSVVISSTSSVDIIAGGTVHVISGQLDLNSRAFTLKSAPNRTLFDGTNTHSLDSTARLGIVTGTLSNASNFAIERYIFAPTVKPRMIATPIVNMQAAQWADSVSIFGGDFRSLAGVPTTTSTLFWYNEQASFGTLTRGFTAITTKATVLNVGTGYRVIVGYDNNPLYTNPAKPAITLKMRGVPHIGGLTVPVTKSGPDPYGWNMVGNPYPCEINWVDFYNDNQANLSATVAILDPKSSGTSDYYYYNAFTNTAIDPRYSVGTPPSGFGVTPRFNVGVIASSQAFYVYKTSAGAGTVSFAESHKVLNPVMTESHFRTTGAITPRLNIVAVTNNGYSDNTYLFFSDEATAAAFDAQFDAYKFSNTNVNIMTNTFGKDMAMNSVEVKSADIYIPLIVSAKAMGTHTLEIREIESLDAGREVYLIDHYTNTVTNITAVNNQYSFALVAGDTASTSRSRFVLRVTTATTVTGVQNTIKTGAMSIYPNPTSADVTISLTDAVNDTYHLEIIDSRGKLVYEDQIIVSGGMMNIRDVGSFLDAGVYTVKISNSEHSYIDKLIYIK